MPTLILPPQSEPNADCEVECEGGIWKLRIGSTSMDWVAPPEVLHGFMSELFASRPRDILSWAHAASWRLREEGWRGRPQSPTSQRANAGPHRLSERLSFSQMSPRHSWQSLNSFQPNPSTTPRPSAGSRAGSQIRHMVSSRTTDSNALSYSLFHTLKNQTASRTPSVSVISKSSRPSNPFSRHPTFVTNGSIMASGSAISGLATESSTHSNIGELMKHFSLFGSQTRELVNHTDSRDRKAYKCFSPTCLPCFLWSGFFTACLLFELWAVPFELVFSRDRLPWWTGATDVFFLVFFTADILLNLRTGYISNGVLETQWRAVANTYMKSWMCIDILATVPYFVRAVASSEAENRVLRCIQLARVFRLKRAEEWMTLAPLFIRILRPVIPIVKLQVGVWLVHHLFSVLFAVAQPEAWIDGHPHGAYGCYWESFWQSFVLISFGSTLAGPPQGRMIAWELAIGTARLLMFLVMLDWTKSYSIVKFSKKYTGFRRDENDAFDQEDQLHAYFDRRGIKPSLRIRVMQVLRATQEVQSSQSKVKWLTSQSIDPDLRYELDGSLWEEKINTLGIMVPLVSWYPPFVVELATFVHEMFLSPSAVLFSNGEPTQTAYFILNGAFAVTTAQSEESVRDYTQGMWVGEQALVNPELLHTETLRCRAGAELMAIHASDFRSLLVRHNLDEDFDSFLQQTLWMGLCGRCGIFGDHFSNECPWREKSRIPFMNRLRRQAGRAETYKIKVDLEKFLENHQLSHLAAELLRYEIMSMNDLTTSAFDDFLEDEDSWVRREDKETLRRAAEKLKKKAVEGTATFLYTTSPDDHFIFISHYKVEAGTEATLIQKDLAGYIEKDPSHPGHGLDAPVFVDSENLYNLADLHNCVRRSRNMLILLTPGLLKRPWVLVEIALAYRYEIHMIPVEIQRPKLKFKYPDDDYLRRVGSGTELDALCLSLLSSEGIELSDLESALRQLFKRVAMPYSPHKSASIREAELKDVLKRCHMRHGKRTVQFNSIQDTLSEPLSSLRSSSPKRSLRSSSPGKTPKTPKTPNTISDKHSPAGRNSFCSRNSGDHDSMQISMAAFQAMDRVRTSRFKEGDTVRVTKDSRTKGKTAVVIDPDWHNLVKVLMDEEDEKGRTKSFKRSELELITETFREPSGVPHSYKAGDQVRIIKDSRTKGMTATIIDPDWHNLVKVSMDEEDSKGKTKSYKAIDLELVSRPDGEPSVDIPLDVAHIERVYFSL